MSKNYFSVDIRDDYENVLFHDTLDEAKRACLNNASDRYDYACGVSDMELYEGMEGKAVYGKILGCCKSECREPDKDDSYESQYSYIVETPELVETNGWISVNDHLPKPDECVLVFFRNKIREYQSITISHFIDGEFNMGSELFEVTHWQPLPERPPISVEKQEN
ncbi:DUF551 domain-containing protein [Pasteurellaceae bacterium LIM206]|nr:DUF551 domain-containing protein [Pasteurellaceae bacterium LIM206]